MYLMILLAFFILVTLIHVFIYFLEKDLFTEIKHIFPKGINQDTSSFFIPTRLQFSLFIWRGNFANSDDGNLAERCKQLRRYYFLEALFGGILVLIFIFLLIYA